MDEHSVLDLPALVLAVAISLVVSATLIAAHGTNNRRRGWIVAGALAAALLAIGVADLVREEPRETHMATVVLGSLFPVFGALGAIRGTHRISRPWIRWPLIFLATFALLFVGLLVGATLVPRYLPI
jgi:hypothetical protein